MQENATIPPHKIYGVGTYTYSLPLVFLDPPPCNSSNDDASWYWQEIAKHKNHTHTRMMNCHGSWLVFCWGATVILAGPAVITPTGTSRLFSATTRTKGMPPQFQLLLCIFCLMPESPDK
jgi:hypothetical protein